MRVYISPGVIAYTTNAASLDANISFAAPDQDVYSYNPVIVVYDNCGKAFSMTISIIVQGPPTPPTDLQVVSPTNGGVVTPPVHFLASASAPGCSRGISAMRIYKAPGVAAYTADDASIDTYLSMATGTYHVVVQAWDHCGNVYKTPLFKGTDSVEIRSRRRSFADKNGLTSGARFHFYDRPAGGRRWPAFSGGPVAEDNWSQPPSRWLLPISWRFPRRKISPS
jgi:hypothetical protein